MAFFYYTYDTTIGNTLISGSTGSSAPLPSGYTEIHIDWEEKYEQPLYLYRESGGTIIENTTGNTAAYQIKYNPPEDDDYITQIELSGNTLVIDDRLLIIEEDLGIGHTGNTNVIIVDKSGAEDFTSVKLAFDSITGSSVIDPYLVQVNAGIYFEDPFNMPEYTELESLGATIEPNNEIVSLINGGSNIKIKNIGINSPNSSFAIDVKGNNIMINGIDVTGTGKGVSVSGSTSGVTIYNSFFRAGLAIGIDANEATLTVNSVDINATTGILARNNSHIDVSSHFSSGIYGFDITNGSTINFDNVRFPSVTTGVRLTNTSHINGITMIMDSVSGWAIQQADATSTVDISDAVFDSTKVQAVNPDNVNISYRAIASRVINAYSGFTGATEQGFAFIVSGITKTNNDIATYYGQPTMTPTRSNIETMPLGELIITGFTTLSGETQRLDSVKLEEAAFTGYSATTKVEIDDKIDKVTGATNNIAFYQADGNITYIDGLTLGFLTGGTGTYFYKDLTSRITTTNTVTTPAIFLSGSTTVGSGRFSVDFNAIGGNSSPNKYIGMQFQIDGTTVGHETKFKTNAGDVDYSANLTKDLDLTTGTHTFRIIFYQQAGGTAYIEYGAIRVRKVS